MASAVIDICRLCGESKPLSFEHVPPRAAYNGFPRFRPDMQQFIAHRYERGPAPKMIHEPRGAGAYTLCVACNNRCGRYAQEFIPWVAGWNGALEQSPRANTIKFAQRFRPSRVMKQIVAMFLSANPPHTGRITPELRRFVKNAEFRGLAPGIRGFVSLTRDKDARQAGVTGKIGPGGASVFSEIAFAPMIFVMTVGHALPPDPRLTDITFFARAAYGELGTIEMELNVLRLADFHPGAYF